jgi:phosphoglycolate phosphatase-like HAD superfamily hydrolase
MIDLCLFDFDNTLMMTDDLKRIREQGKERSSDRSYRAELESLIGDIKSRLIYTEEDLQQLRIKNPSTKFALFTLAPMAYLEVIDNMAYPNFHWDDVVCYECITDNNYKPSGFGIEIIMQRYGLLDPSRVAMVGDSINDIASAYNAGCYAVLDQSSWPEIKTDQHWSAIKLIPDLIMQSKSQLSEFLRDQATFLPGLENLLGRNCGQIDGRDLDNLRFDSTYYFSPRENSDFDKGVVIHCAGRLFSNYKSLEARRQ